MAKIKGVWVFNEKFADGEFDLTATGISFTSYNMEFEGIHPSGGLSSNGEYKSVMHYKRKGVAYWDVIAQSSYHGYANGWQNDAFRTVDFGETEQTVSDDFYAWFIVNATQQAEPEEPSTPKRKFTKLFLGDVVKTAGNKVFRKLTTEQPVVEDETIVGTWLFNENIAVNGGAWYSVNFTSNGVSYIAMSDRSSQTSTIHDMTLRYFKNSTIYVYAFNGSGTWEDEAYRTIIINEEPTDKEFITWLKANATKQKPTIITFTIGGTTYQAEEGMTWGEFCDSEYSNGGFYVRDYGSYNYIIERATERRIDYASVPQDKDTVIVENQVYYTSDPSN